MSCMYRYRHVDLTTCSEVDNVETHVKMGERIGVAVLPAATAAAAATAADAEPEPE